MDIIGYIAAIFIGISLGLVGSGGSILAFPILVYLFKINSEEATVYSLFIVGFTALVGTLKQYRLGNLQIKSGLIFAIPSVISLLLVRSIILPLIPYKLFQINQLVFTKHVLIIVVFALLMIAASFSMIKKVKLEKVATKIKILLK